MRCCMTADMKFRDREWQMNGKTIYADTYIKDKNHVLLREIKAMLAAVSEEKGGTVRFGEGIYFLEEWESHPTLSIAHDDGCGDIRQKECHIILKGMEHLTLEGVCRDGVPATVLSGYNSGENQTLLPSVLWAEDCVGLTLKNLAVTRAPECASAGRIVKIEDGRIYVEVFSGNPCHDGMAAYCMNRFSLPDKELLGESLTYGFGYEKRFRLAGDRLLVLEDRDLAGKVKVGEGLSWHQAGKTDFQMFFGNCDGLRLLNIRIYNTNSFALLTENCCGIYAEGLVIKPKGNQLFTGPRDGWKIYRCTGKIEIHDCVTEGVRMDGQNVHSNFLVVTEVVSERELIAVCKYAPIPMRNGYSMKFYQGDRVEVCEAEAWEILDSYLEMTSQEENDSAALAVTGVLHRMTRYRIRFKEDMPDFAEKGTLLCAGCWEPESYLCTDSVYRNIAGAGHLLRCGSVEITRCTYENMMNAGILIGAEFDTHCEGGHGDGVRIRHNVFRKCGTKARYGKYGRGCVAVKSQGFHLPVNRDIVITDNVFAESDRALEIRDAKNVVIKNNEYRAVREEIFVDAESTENIEKERS